MERDFGNAEQKLNTSLARIICALEFLIDLVSNHAEMIQFQAQVHFDLLNQKMEILDLKMEIAIGKQNVDFSFG